MMPLSRESMESHSLELDPINEQSVIHTLWRRERRLSPLPDKYQSSHSLVEYRTPATRSIVIHCKVA